jgi:hypothetical protein
MRLWALWKGLCSSVPTTKRPKRVISFLERHARTQIIKYLVALLDEEKVCKAMQEVEGQRKPNDAKK